MERSVEVLAVILSGVLGLSHIMVGWCLLIKSLIRFCAPKLALRMMSRVSVERSWEFQVAGAALVVLAGLIGYGVYAG
jgi:hypothetical protein